MAPCALGFHETYQHSCRMKSYNAGFVISQILGHAVHGERIRTAVMHDPEIRPHWMPIFPWAKDFWRAVPIVGTNLTLVSGLQARRQLRACRTPLDVLYCHTQEAAVLLGSYMKRIPTILSMDATPTNMGHLRRGLRPPGRLGRAGAPQTSYSPQILSLGHAHRDVQQLGQTVACQGLSGPGPEDNRQYTRRRSVALERQ